MAKEKPKPGPQEDRLILEGPWEDRVRDSLAKKRPPRGWPERPTKKRKPKGKTKN